jgi:hypothetical protein
MDAGPELSNHIAAAPKVSPAFLARVSLISDAGGLWLLGRPRFGYAQQERAARRWSGSHFPPRVPRSRRLPVTTAVATWVRLRVGAAQVQGLRCNHLRRCCNHLRRLRDLRVNV